jgi:hypothetical protein
MKYRDRTSGDVLTKAQVIARQPNVSAPAQWSSSVYDTYNIDPITETAPPATTTYQRAVEDGVVSDGNGGYTTNWVIETLSEEEQTALDARTADQVRSERSALLAQSDWIVIKAKELGTEVPATWLSYRSALRDVPSQGGFPHNVTWPTKPE